jgi:hypothetical protein
MLNKFQLIARLSKAYWILLIKHLRDISLETKKAKQQKPSSLCDRGFYYAADSTMLQFNNVSKFAYHIERNIKKFFVFFVIQ